MFLKQTNTSATTKNWIMKIINSLLVPLGLEANQASGILDFILGFILVIMTWFFVQENNMQLLVSVMGTGSALVLYSIFTDYKYGILRFIARKIHEAMNLTLGITFMALWSIGFTTAGLFFTILFVAGLFLF